MTQAQTLFLSRLLLNPRSRDARRNLTDCQGMHRTLMAAFPHAEHEAARAEFGLLYRVEINPRDGKVAALVQSQLQPDWSKLPLNYLLDEADNPACKALSDQYSKLHDQMQLRFRLRANPTRKICTKSLPDGTKQNGKRIDLRREEDQIAWLKRKAETHGFRLVGVRVDASVLNLRANPESVSIGWRKHNDLERNRLTFGSVLFEGELMITDAAKFHTALSQGIGSGKAYGFGLLSIAPVRQVS